MNDKLLIMRAFGAEKRAADMLGVGPSESKPKSGAITKTTGPMSGNNALGSLVGYTRGKTTAAAANERDATDKSKEQPTEKKVEKLESASDTPPKPAPRKKPEKESENEVEYEKEAKISGSELAMLLRVLGKTVGETTAGGAAWGGAGGAGIGAAAGEPGKRGKSALRGAVRGAATGAGIGAGLGLGSGLGFLINTLLSKRRGLATAIGLPLGLGLTAGGGYLGHKLGGKLVGEKKSSFAKAAVGPGTAIGALIGGLRGKEPREDRGDAIIRSAFTGMGADVGAPIGALGGGALGGYLAPKITEDSNKQALITLLGALLGGGLGAYGGYSLMKRRPGSRKAAQFRLPFAKRAAPYGEDKGLSRTQKLLIGALAGAGVPVALWHGSGPLVRKLIQKIYKLAPLEKLYNLPQTHPRLAKGLMYSPAAAGAAIGGLSGGDADEFKLSAAIMPIVKAGQTTSMLANRMREHQTPPGGAPADIIPGIGPLGGKVLQGLSGITGGIGMPSISERLQEWSQSPTARAIAGGGTTTLAALLAALAVRRLARGREAEVEG